MSRKLRPLQTDNLGALPCACEGCVFWETDQPLEMRCGAKCDMERLREWYGEVSREWGDCGRVASEDDEILGFIKYAPPEFFPQVRYMPSGPPEEKSVLITCMHIRDDARQHGLGRLLLQAALRDLTMRGVRTVQSYAYTTRGDMTYVPTIGVEFLLRNGFTVARPHPSYPLLKLDTRSLAQWTDNLEAVLESLRIPLRRPKPVPTPSVE